MSARSLRRNHARALADERRRDSRRGRRAGLAAGVALGATVLFAPSAGAATFEVNSTADAASDACDTDCTLRDAIDAANADTDGNPDTITFASSISGSTITLDGNQLDITDPEGLTITGPGAANLIIDANHESRHFYVNTAAPVSISGLTLQNGKFTTQKYSSLDAGTGDNGPGGGSILTAPGSDLTVSDSVIKDNEADNGSESYAQRASGGGIAGQASTSTSSTPRSPATPPMRGAAASSSTTRSSTTASRRQPTPAPAGTSNRWTARADPEACFFSNKYSDGPSTLTVTSGSQVTGNVAAYGGGISAFGTTTTVSGSGVTGNTANDGDGGGIRSVEDRHISFTPATGGTDATTQAGVTTGSLAIDTSHIDDNDANGNAGGISLPSFTGFSLADSTVSGNDATDGAGGGIYQGYGEPSQQPATGSADAGAPSDGSTEIARSTIADNTSYAGGGGIYVKGVSADTSFLVSRSTLSGNTANFETDTKDDIYFTGGGINFDGEINGSATVSDSTVSGNSAMSGGGISFDGAYVDQEPESAPAKAGGADEIGKGGSVLIANTTIDANAATSKGGGIYLGGYGGERRRIRPAT